MREFFQQIQKFWGELGSNQRVSIVMAMFLVIGGMVALLVWSSRPQMVLLYGGLESRDLSAVVKALDDKGIEYELKQGSSVYVPRAEVYTMRMDLASRGVPTGGGIGYEIFDKTNFGVSDFVQRTNYIRAIQGELGRTITQLKGVRSARVMIVVPENRLVVTNEKNRSTASVFVDTGGTQMDVGSVNAIRFLVASSVEGLQVNDVVVVDSNGRPLSQDLVDDGATGAATGQFKLRKNLEDYFTQKVESMLSRVVGPENVVARVSVSLNMDSGTLVEEKYDPEGQVIRTQSQIDESNSATESRKDNLVGVESNNPDKTPEVNQPNVENSSAENRKNRNITYEINKSTREVVSLPGTIRNITAAVFVARKYRDEKGERIMIPRSPEELEGMRQMVINAVGVSKDGAATDVSGVTLQEMDFVQPEVVQTTQLEKVEERVFQWVEVGRNFMAVGIAVVMFFVFLRLLKKHRPEAVQFEVLDERNAQIRAQQDQLPRLTPDLLNELIREKPENVSTALKNWAIDQKKT
jgi:flagellar M-ring protein FliF